jgi:hypothetical protein
VVFGAFRHKVTGPASAFFLSRLNGVRQVAQLVKAWVVGTVNGRMTWTRGTASHALAVTTVKPLHHDAACTSHPRFTAGELMVTKTGSNGTVTIHIVFTGCGVEPTVTVERSSA